MSGSEWKTNVLALSIIVAILAVAAVFALRPAIVLGVDDGALADSLSGTSSSCAQVSDQRWHCRVADPSGGAERDYTLRMHALGCWDAYSRPGGPSQDSGCISILNEL